MMGTHKSQKDLFSFCVDLDERVRPENPLRKVAEAVDFSFVREAVKDCYGHNGNESVDPEIILKLMFLLFWDDIRSERELMRMLPERLDYLWFLVMGSLIDADASKDSVVKASAELIDQLREAYGAVEAKLDGHLGDPYYQPVNRKLLSTTDPDAPCVSHKKSGGGGESRPRYKNHRAVDDKHGVITATTTTPGDLDEGTQVETLINEHEKNSGETVEAAIGDSQYGTAEVMCNLQARGIRAHMKVHAGNARKDLKIFSKSDFEYNPEENVYICPAGETLYPRRYDKRRKATEYTTGKNVCAYCQLRDACTKSKTGRTNMRHLGQELIDDAIEQSRSKEAWRDRIRRRYLMEGSFAQSTNLHHFKRSRWRRLGNQRIQDWIICTIQNTKILITRSLPPKTTAEALTGLKYKIQNLNTPLKYLYKALIRKVRARYGDNDCLSTSSVNTHAILPHPFLSPFGQQPLKN